VRIAHLTTVDLSLRYLLLPQLRAIVELGGEAIGISAPGPDVPALEQAGIRHIPLPGSTRSFSLRSDLRAMVSLWRILRRERPDVLHTHNPKPGLYGRVVGRVAGVPVIVNTIHGLYATPDDPWPKRALVYGLETLASRCSDVELVQSREDVELVTRRHITPPDRTVLLGNGVDLERFDPDRLPEGTRDEVRRSLGIPEDRIVVGIVGRLVAEKGFPELLQAMEQLDERFVLVAIGPYDPDKADAVSPASVEAARRRGHLFLGMRTDVDALYTAIDIFVLPSHREGFPRAAMEAAAMGLPIVATDIRGCREVVEHERTGLLVPVRSPDELASAIRRLGDDPALRRRLGAAGRAKAVAEFDERKVVEIVVSAELTALRAAGAFTAAEVPLTEASYRAAIPTDAPLLARLHAEGIATGFLPRLGLRFLTELYRALIQDPDSVVLVATDGWAPIGFVAGTTDVDAFYRRFVRRRGVRAGIAALPRLVRPANARRAWETWRYEGDHLGIPAELLSMAVMTSARGRGIGTELGRRFLREIHERGATRVKVVVAADNTVAQRAYRSMGFSEAGTIEVHRGEPSVIMATGSRR